MFRRVRESNELRRRGPENRHRRWWTTYGGVTHSRHSILYSKVLMQPIWPKFFSILIPPTFPRDDLDQGSTSCSVLLYVSTRASTSSWQKNAILELKFNEGAWYSVLGNHILDEKAAWNMAAVNGWSTSTCTVCLCNSSSQNRWRPHTPQRKYVEQPLQGRMQWILPTQYPQLPQLWMSCAELAWRDSTNLGMKPFWVRCRSTLTSILEQLPRKRRCEFPKQLTMN